MEDSLGGSWTFLLVGSFGAVGAAMAVGTLAALLRYHRTGTWPGGESTGEITTGRLVGLWTRVLLGVIVAGYAAVSLSDSGLL